MIAADPKRDTVVEANMAPTREMEMAFKIHQIKRLRRSARWKADKIAKLREQP